MVATLKSRVLVREEKGVGSVSMKRIIFCAMGAGMFYFASQLTPLRSMSLLVLLTAFIFLIIISGQTYGVPRYIWWAARWRGRLLLAAYRSPDGLSGQVCRLVDWEAETVVADGAAFFQASGEVEEDWAGITFYTSDALVAGGVEFLLDDDDVLLLEAVN